MPAAVVLVERVSVYKQISNYFILPVYAGYFFAENLFKKNSPFQGNFAVRFGKGSVRFDTKINQIKNQEKIAFLVNFFPV